MEVTEGDEEKTNKIINRSITLSISGLSFVMFTLGLLIMLLGGMTYFNTYENNDTIRQFSGISIYLQKELFHWQVKIIDADKNNKSNYRLSIFILGLFLTLGAVLNFIGSILQNRYLIGVSALVYIIISTCLFILTSIYGTILFAFTSQHCHELKSIFFKNQNFTDFKIIMNEMLCCGSIGYQEYSQYPALMNCCTKPDICMKSVLGGGNNVLPGCCFEFIKHLKTWSILVFAFMVSFTTICFITTALKLMMVVTFSEIDSEIGYLQKMVSNLKQEVNSQRVTYPNQNTMGI